LQENIEECQSAAEFLLEPWVLIQLPFKPLLLHQWCVALIAEALKFYKELGDMTTVVPSRLHRPVTKLVEMYNLMMRTACNYIINVVAYVYGGVCSYTLDNLPEVLSVLEFVLSDECRNGVKALKNLAWNSTTKSSLRELPVKMNGLDFDSFCCYNKNYWKRKKVVNDICPRVGDGSVSNRKTVKKCDEGNITDSEREAVKKFIKEKILTTGRMKQDCIADALLMIDNSKPLVNSLVPVYRSYLEDLGENQKIEFLGNLSILLKGDLLYATYFYSNIERFEWDSRTRLRCNVQYFLPHFGHQPG